MLSYMTCDGGQLWSCMLPQAGGLQHDNGGEGARAAGSNILSKSVHGRLCLLCEGADAAIYQL